MSKNRINIMKRLSWGSFDDKDKLEAQRRRARWIIACLMIGLLIYMWLWIAIKTEPEPLWPFKWIAVEYEKYDPRWLLWFFTGAIGTYVYLLWEAAQKFMYLVPDDSYLKRHLLEDENDEENNDNQTVNENQPPPEEGATVDPTDSEKWKHEANFISYTPWYLVNAIRGPLIAMVVMFLLINITFDTGIKASDNSDSAGSDDAGLVEDEEDTLDRQNGTEEGDELSNGSDDEDGFEDDNLDETNGDLTEPDAVEATDEDEDTSDTQNGSEQDDEPDDDPDSEENANDDDEAADEDSLEEDNLDTENGSEEDGELGDDVDEGELANDDEASDGSADDENVQAGISGSAIGLSIDLSHANGEVLLIVVFLLGFFNRIPYHILLRAASSIFSKAYKDANYPEP